MSGKARLRGIAFCLAIGVAAAGCGGTAGGVQRGGQVSVDNAQLVCGGVLRVEIAQEAKFADLTIQRMTGPDTLTGGASPCITTMLGQKLAYYDLNWTGVANRVSLPALTLGLSAPDRGEVVAELPNGTCEQMQSARIPALPADDGEQYVLQLFSRRVGAIPALSVRVDGVPIQLPLVRACGNRVQTSAQTCTEDPLSYVSGAPSVADVVVS